MNRKQLLQELIDWSIDRGDRELPVHLAEGLRQFPDVEAEWNKEKSLIGRLHHPGQWSPSDDYFPRLAQNAVQEKRRAMLSDTTRRAMNLNWSESHYFTFWSWRSALAGVIAAVVLIPLAMFSYSRYNTIGGVLYVSGYVFTEKANRSDSHRDDPISRNQAFQTTTQSQGIVRLNSGAEICVDNRSRLTFVDARHVELHVGRVYFDIPKSGEGFRVRLPRGEVFVLGTAFSIEVDSNQCRISVTRGTVRVIQGDHELLLREGSETNLTGREKPSAYQNPQVSKQIRWVAELRRKQEQDEIERYFPSLTTSRRG